MATAQEMKQRARYRERTAAVLQIIKELYPKGESNKTRLFEEGKKRLTLGRRILESIIDNGVGVSWTCTTIGTKYIYAPLGDGSCTSCTDDMYTMKEKNAENACHDKGNDRVHDEKTAFVHDEHNPSCSCTSCTPPFKGVHVHEQGQTFQNAQNENFISEGTETPETDRTDDEGFEGDDVVDLGDVVIE